MASVATLKDTTIVGEYDEQLVTMIVDKQLFGIPILQVQDIVEASKITPVPLAPSAIAGVLNLRGRIVTVIDLRKLMGNFEEVPWESQMGVTVEHKGDLYTLLVDAIGDVRTLPRRDFDKAPSTLQENVRLLCSGIFRLRGNLLVVLDVSRILLPDAIEATPALSVEDRRARKEAAIAANDETKSERGRRQLSALMTDLNAYESDFDSGLDSLSGDTDDIKARKRANRDRRPVGERWREVLDEKARRDGATVYRMREPDEETLEEARDKEEEQQSSWETEWKARQDGRYVSRLPEPEDGDAGDAGPDDQLTPADEPVAYDPAPVDEPAPDAEASGFDALQTPDSMKADTDEPASVGDMVSDWWGKMRGKPESGADADDPMAEADPVELPMADELALDTTTDESPVEISAADESAPEAVAEADPVELPMADEPTFDAVTDEPPVELPTADEPAREAVAEEAPVELPMADEPTLDAATDEFPVELPAADEPDGDIPASDEPAAEDKPAGKAKASSDGKKKKAAKASSSKPKAKSASRAKKK